MKAIKISDELLKATLNCEEKVAELIDKAHTDNTSILKYNYENSLSCVISLAYYSARKIYTIERELPAGKGYADCLKDYLGDILLVGINYNKYDKQHTCKIEKITK